MAWRRVPDEDGKRGVVASLFHCVWPRTDEHPTTPQEPLTDEDCQKELLELRMDEVNARAKRSRKRPSSLGEQLCTAARDGNPKDVRRLLDGGADVNYTHTDGRSVLLSTFDFGWDSLVANLEVVELLLERGADVNAIDDGGYSALHFAAFLGHASSERYAALLIAAGANVNAREKNGATPLHFAAFKNKNAAVRTLLAAGADKNLRGWGKEYKNKTPADVTTEESIRNLLRQ